tara:strand:+ start:55 stop:498 length:444 start_codon:yes stop_codon:yes gene_type:complete
MKRLNKETGLPFKCGNIREDGFIFDAYVKSVTRKTGFYKEIWRSPKQHAKEMQRKIDGKKIKYDLISEHINNIKLKKGCLHCGYNKYAIALDFHHLDKLLKEKNISSYWRTSWAQFKQIENEIKKCEILCANCHRVEEQKLRKNKNV